METQTQIAKEIIIDIAGAEGRREQKVKLLPGTTARDVLQGLKLVDYSLNKPKGGFFAPNDIVYDAVPEGGKLYATPGKVEAGIA